MDHYKVLGLTPDSSQDEIRKRYQELLLRFHPDKRDVTRETSSTSVLDSDDSIPFESKFHLLELSWNVLRDPQSRRDYDASVRQKNKIQSHPIGDLVRFADMTEEVDERLDDDDDDEEERTVWSYPCRCGGEYTMYSDDDCFVEWAEDKDTGTTVTLCCPDCSLAISISK